MVDLAPGEKECNRCGLPKTRKHFLFKIKNVEKERSYCSECRNVVRKRHYVANRVDYVGRSKLFRAEQKERYFLWLRDNPCVDCGETDVVVLEPDHVRGIKRRNVSQVINHGEPWSAILEELEKCDVRCSNCHTRKTAREQGWYKHVRSLVSGPELLVSMTESGVEDENHIGQ